MAQWALITGATSGIGRAIAEQLAQNKWNLILTGRRGERLQEIQSQLQEENAIQVKTLCFDVSNRASCEAAVSENAGLFQDLGVLVNNAGLARGVETMDEAKLDDWEEMIDTNIKGLLYMTRLCLPFLKTNPPAHIVNLGSVAGRWAYRGGGVYCATKFAVRALSESLRMDLIGENIRVTNISPGMVETEFSEVRFGDIDKAKQVYKGVNALSAKDIADCVTWSLSRPAHVNIQEMVVFPTDQAAIAQVHRR